MGAGGGVNGVEAIAQARLIAKLNTIANPASGVATSIQWEPRLVSPSGRTRYPDVTYDSGNAIQVYEVKDLRRQTIAQANGQLGGYLDTLDALGVSPGATEATVLANWHDSFLVPDPTQAPCPGPGGTHFPRFRLYVDYQPQDDPGIWAVDGGWLLDCFNPQNEPVPALASAPALNGADWSSWAGSFGEGAQPPQTLPGFGLPAPADGSPSSLVANGLLPGPSSAPGSDIDPRDIFRTGPSQRWKLLLSVGAKLERQLGQLSGVLAAFFGDPHQTTFDGLTYDFQGAGEFNVVDAQQYGMQVQARFEPLDSNASISMPEQVAFTLEGHTIQVSDSRADTSSLLIDGQPYSLAVGQMLNFGDGAILCHGSSGYLAVWAGAGDRPMLFTGPGALQIHVPLGTDTDGLLGDHNGDTSNDLVTADGTQLSVDTPASTLYGTFANSWRVTTDDSLFTYGSGESPDTYSDPTFPHSIVTLNDLAPSAVAAAANACSAGGVGFGPTYNACLLDYAETQDQNYVAAAADQSPPTDMLGARTVDASGQLSEDFENGIASNLAASRYGSEGTTGRYAGPFGPGESYSYSLSQLPGHDSETIQFDAIALGDWSPALYNNTISVTVNGQNVLTTAVGNGTPSATGTTSSGQGYAVYPLSVQVPDASSQLDVGISADIQSGSQQAFGVDNLHAALDLVTPQSFAVSLPATISDGQPSDGSGNLETTGSEDDYRFTTNYDATIAFDLSSCTSGGLNWQLVDTTTGDVVSSAQGDCGHDEIPDVPSGSYSLQVSDPGVTQTYSLSLQVKPPPDTYSVSLPTSISDGQPAAGAGNLETTSSQDDYAFTTAADGTVVLDFANCNPGPMTWALVDASSGSTIGNGAGDCGHDEIPNVPAGSYTLQVSDPGATGSYNVNLALKPSPDTFHVSLPASISDGQPAAGAGNLETTSSEDDYTFSTATDATVALDLSNCQAGGLSWQLVDTSSSSAIASGSCGHAEIPNVPAGSYALQVTAPGSTGTYGADIALKPPPDTFAVSLPASISDGQPTSGAGHLETTASEDDYAFTTTTNAAAVVVDTTDCSLTNLRWELVDSSANVVSAGGCGHTESPAVPAGSYVLQVTAPGSTGTYGLAVSSKPPPDTFTVALPASISDGQPAAGAGHLEATSSEDDYHFGLAVPGTVLVSFPADGHCGAQLAWVLIQDSTGNAVDSGPGCGDFSYPNASAGSYTLQVSDPGQTTSYSASVAYQSPVTVTAAAPAYALQGTSNANIRITGAGFARGATVGFSGSGITVNSSTYTSSTSVTANVTISAAATVGARDVTVTNPNHTTNIASGAFNVSASPTVASISPASLPIGASHQTIQITGTHLEPGATVALSGAGVTVNSSSNQSSTTMTAVVTVASTATTGARNLTITNPDSGTTTQTGGLTVAPAPTVASASPHALAQGAGNQNVTITGTGFENGATVAFSGTGITVNSATYTTSTSLTANLTLDPGSPTGQRNITITNPDASKATGTRLLTIDTAPSVGSIDTNAIVAGASNQTIQITGASFATGAIAAFSGPGITVNSTTYNSSTALTANVTVAAGAGAGPRDLTVTNTDAGTSTCSACVNVFAAPQAASGATTSGSTVTSSSLAILPGIRYLVFASTKSSSGDTATITTTGFTTAPTSTAIGSQENYDASTAHNRAWYLNGGSGTGTITITFTKPTTQAYVRVIAISGAPATGKPISTTTIGTAVSGGSASSTTTSTPATATLASAPDPTDAELILWSSDGQTGATAPAASLSPFSAIASSYAAASSGSSAVYAGAATSASVNLALPASQRWGTIAIELLHS